MKKNLREYFVGLITFLTFISFIISGISLVGYFKNGTSDELDVFMIFGLLFLLFFGMTCFVRGGFAWLLTWFTTLP